MVRVWHLAAAYLGLVPGGCAVAPGSHAGAPLAVVVAASEPEPEQAPGPAADFGPPEAPAPAMERVAPSPLAEPALAVVPARPALLPVLHPIEPNGAPQTIEVVVGQEVRFVNRDAICHGFFSSSAPNTFDSGLLHPGATAVVTFAHPGTVQVYCSLHQHRQLTIEVVPAPRPR